MAKHAGYVSGAHSTTSWLEHIICSHDVNCKVTSNKLPISDYLPLQAALDVDFNCVFNCVDVSACPKDKISYIWSQCTSDDLEKYYCSTYDLFIDNLVLNVMIQIVNYLVTDLILIAYVRIFVML